MHFKFRILLGIITTGILGILIYPTVLFGHRLPDLGIFAWIYLVPLFVILHHLKGKERFLSACLCSFIFYGGSLYWLVTAMHDFGGLAFIESLGVMFLVALLLSLYFAVALFLSYWTYERTKIPLFVLNTVFLISFDFLRTYWPFNGFPWPMTAYSQGGYLPYLQWVDITGVFGLSAYIFLVNGLFAEMALIWIHREEKDRFINRTVILILLVMVSFGWSYLQQKKMQEDGQTVGNFQVALIQGNIPQDLKWDPRKAQNNLNNYLSLTERAAKDGADLAIWPETAFPYTIDLSDMLDAKILRRERLSIPVVLGSVSQMPTEFDKEPSFYNSAFYLSEDSRLRQVYHKTHLVPFGEYIPMKKLLRFARRLTIAVGDFTPGESFQVLQYRTLKMAPLICYEDIFPDISRSFSKRGAHLLVNMTNDAWYGNTSAQYQHLVFSQFRALENRRYLVRATNTGVTAVIDPHGKVIQDLDPFKEDVLLRNIKLKTRDTIYMKIGDLVAWISVFASIGALIYGRFKKRKLTAKLAEEEASDY